MRRPFKDIRLIGPFAQLRNFNQGSGSDMQVEYTLLYSSPQIPSRFDAPDEVVESTINTVERQLRTQFDLSASQYAVFTESIVPEDMRQDGNLLVVKLKGVSMSSTEAARLQDELIMTRGSMIGIDQVESQLYEKDFFLDSDSTKVE